MHFQWNERPLLKLLEVFWDLREQLSESVFSVLSNLLLK